MKTLFYVAFLQLFTRKINKILGGSKLPKCSKMPLAKDQAFSVVAAKIYNGAYQNVVATSGNNFL